MAFYRLEKTMRNSILHRAVFGARIDRICNVVRSAVCLFIFISIRFDAVRHEVLGFFAQFSFCEDRTPPISTQHSHCHQRFLIYHLSNCMNLRIVRRHAIFHSFSFGRPKMSSDKLCDNIIFDRGRRHKWSILGRWFHSCAIHFDFDSNMEREKNIKCSNLLNEIHEASLMPSDEINQCLPPQTPHSRGHSCK